MKKLFFFVSHIHELWDKVDALLQSNEQILSTLGSIDKKVFHDMAVHTVTLEEVKKIAAVVSLKYDRILDTQEVVDMLGTTKWVVCNACRQGDIKAEKNEGGRKWKIRLSEIQRICDACAVGSIIAKNQKPGKEEQPCTTEENS